MPADGETGRGPTSPSHKLRNSFSFTPKERLAATELDISGYLDSEETSKSMREFPLYKFYLSFVVQDSTYVSAVPPLPSSATMRETLKWYIAYPFRREKPIINFLWIVLPIYLMCALIHGWGTRLAYFFHTGGPRLFDSGFALLPELQPQYKILSEVFFNCIFIGTLVLIAFHPQRFRLFIRILFMFAFLYLCRCASFLSTILPSPASHCDVTSEAYAPPRNAMDILMPYKFTATAGCGDLIFSGHSLHSTTVVLIWMKYCNSVFLKVVMGSCQITLYLLIIAARKHYSIDVLVAAYLVPFVFLFYTDRFEPWLFRNVKKRKEKSDVHEGISNGKDKLGAFMV